MKLSRNKIKKIKKIKNQSRKKMLKRKRKNNKKKRTFRKKRHLNLKKKSLKNILKINKQVGGSEERLRFKINELNGRLQMWIPSAYISGPAKYEAININKMRDVIWVMKI